MEFYLKILFYLPVLCCNAKRSKIGAHGYEGGTLDIECSYPDGYQYKPKYFCRHPCANNNILIRSVKADILVQVGRFSVYDNIHGLTFTVTIKNLNLQDSGFYYCGLDKWGRDFLTEIEISVGKVQLVTSLSTSTPVADATNFTQVAYKKIPVADWNATHPVSVILIDSPGFVSVHGVVGAVVGLSVCCAAVLFTVLLRQHSMFLSLTLPSTALSSPIDETRGEEETGHVYDEINIYSSNFLPQEDSDLYCTIRIWDDNALYSLLTLN